MYYMILNSATVNNLVDPPLHAPPTRIENDRPENVRIVVSGFSHTESCKFSVQPPFRRKQSRFDAVSITSCTLNCYDLVPTEFFFWHPKIFLPGVS